MKKILFCVSLILIVFLILSGCSNKSNFDETDTSYVSDTTVSTTEPNTTNINTEIYTEEFVDFSIPTEFVDYRKFIGKDISILNVDTSDWDFYYSSHDLWKSSFYGHQGTLSVGLGWDNKTIIRFFLVLDDNDKIRDDERDELNKKVKDIFGSSVDETMISYHFYGKGNYAFDVPKTLKQESVCHLTWNDDILYNYQISRPKEPTESTQTETTKPKREPKVGMTADEIRQSTWGEPKSINKTTYSWGTKEQWCYSGYRYIYFENGVVTAIQEHN